MSKPFFEQPPYPTREGLPIAVQELGVRASHLNPDVQSNYNNHHLCFTAKKMGELMVLQTLRDLDPYQAILPLDVHQWGVHQRWSAPNIELQAAYHRVHEAYENNELLRFGSARNPTYGLITAEKIDDIETEWQSLSYQGSRAVVL